jgi:hypothetical protein
MVNRNRPLILALAVSSSQPVFGAIKPVGHVPPSASVIARLAFSMPNRFHLRLLFDLRVLRAPGRAVRRDGLSSHQFLWFFPHDSRRVLRSWPEF